jgi:hypothetical protein
MDKTDLVNLFNTFYELNAKLAKGRHSEAAISLEQVVLQVLAKLLHHDEGLLPHSFGFKITSSV